MDKIHSDIVIIGGGISGLWLYNTLKSQGKQVVLIEKFSLGSGQSIASQGMVHGGQRYALQGQNTTHSTSIADMPALWDKALAGEGDVNLKTAELLSSKQVMWSPGSLASKMTAFFASKSMRARVSKLKKDHYPKALAHPDFKGSVYQMDECILDMGSTLNVLATQFAEGIYKGSIKTYHLKKEEEGMEQGFSSLILEEGDKEVEITSRHFIFTAAKGNEEALKALGISPETQTQRRALHQVMVKGDLPEIHGHCLAPDYEPRVTITTHQTQNSEKVWYLGGRLSTRTTELSAEENIQNAKRELELIFPWIDFSNKEWSTLLIDRAESKYEKGLADGPVVKSYGNTHICWPTKLTFAPALTTLLMEKFGADFKEGGSAKLPFSRPEIARYPWDMEKVWIKL